MKILIVEESRVMRQILVRTLRQAGHAAHLVVEAVDGPDGLRAVREEAPDLVLAGWNLPGMSGLELLRTLRAAGHGVRLGFVTAEATSPQVVEQAEHAGAAFVVGKPFTADILDEALGPVLG